MLRLLIVANIVFGSAVYFYFYQLWPQRRGPHKSIRIRSDRHFMLVYRYLQVSTPIYAFLALADHSLPWGTPVAWIGLCLSMASTVLFIWSMLSLRGRYSHCFDSFVPDSLTERGPYNFIRHPIYAANCLMLVGLFLSTSSWGVLANCVILAIYYYRAAGREEASLVQYLPGYAAYLRRTGKFLPRLTREASKQQECQTN
jgi:protein-S-isoprenylcysteine O-methyltransferase Ste14